MPLTWATMLLVSRIKRQAPFTHGDVDEAGEIQRELDELRQEAATEAGDAEAAAALVAQLEDEAVNVTPEPGVGAEPVAAHAEAPAAEAAETSDLDQPVAALLAAGCEHGIQTYTCNECRYEVGVAKAGEEMFDPASGGMLTTIRAGERARSCPCSHGCRRPSRTASSRPAAHRASCWPPTSPRPR